MNNVEDFPFKDGDKVKGMTYTSIEYDRDSEEVEGTLETRPSPFGGPPQCWIDGKEIDPATIKGIE